MQTIIINAVEVGAPVLKKTESGYMLGGWSIGMPTPFEENEIVFYFRAVSGRIMSINAGNLFCERDGVSMLALRGGNAADSPVAAMWSGAAGEEPTMIIVDKCCPAGDFEYSLLPPELSGGSLISVVESISPAASRRVRNMNAKVRLLHQIVPQDAVAALEKQVDMMMQLIAPLLDLIPEEKRPEWSGDFLAAVEKHSAAGVRAPAELIEDISAQKAVIRAAQGAYFAERASV
ncbi:hypothetical protein [Uliginosibacterium sediminicola]|uniref:Uncharacterized protein n=1 Tax=Uliginosibacterium sediminicola TaxID=2024550 RepID=A0ABU9YVS1_9RHOO